MVANYCKHSEETPFYWCSAVACGTVLNEAATHSSEAGQYQSEALVTMMSGRPAPCFLVQQPRHSAVLDANVASSRA